LGCDGDHRRGQLNVARMHQQTGVKIMPTVRYIYTMKTAFLTSACAIALSGCTTLEVGKAGVEADTREGIAYFLPFTQYDSTITWSAACDKVTNELEITASAEMKPKTGPDADALYVIDYQSLSAFTKTSSVDVKFYDSGAIKSINAEADDRTGAIVTKTLTAIGKVAAFGVGDGQDTGRSTPKCSTALLTAIDAVKEAKSGEAGVTKFTTLLAGETRELERITALIVRAGKSASDSLRESHLAAIRKVAARQIELDTAKRVLEAALKNVRHQKKTTFPSHSSELSSTEPLLISKRTLTSWISNLDSFSETETGSGNTIDDIRKSASIWLALSSRASAAAGKEHRSEAAKRAAGIRYRVGMPGTLSVCRSASCNDSLSSTLEIVKKFPVTMLQQGSTFYLPFHSKAFTNGALEATFSEAGVMTSAGYKQKRAAGEALGDVAATLADQVIAVGQAVRASQKTEAELLGDQIALANKRKELADALAELEDSPNSALTDETTALSASTALKQQQLADLNADIALQNARNQLAEIGNAE